MFGSKLQCLNALTRAVAFVAFLTVDGLAADKSGVGPNSISLPKGPGSIEGLGESFQSTLNTGTAKYSIPLKLPPGTAGHAPELSLAYESGGGNGPLGFGWNLSLPYVQRRSDHGIPTYGTNAPFPRDDTFITEMKEELVPLTNGYYFCKDEGVFIRYRQVTNHWEGVMPDGTLMEFGLTADGRIEDTNASPPRVFCWLLQRETDTHGNVILYSYTNFPGASNLNQKYLSGVAYGGGGPPWNDFHFVALRYEDRADWFEDCRSGFVVRTGKRLKSIVIGTQGPPLPTHLAGDFNYDGSSDSLDRRYGLTYLDYAGTNSFWSLLAKVQLTGADGVSPLPPGTFGYSVSNPPDTVSAAGQAIGGANEPPFVMDNPFVELVDLNGDGLPDILKTDLAGGQHTAYLNQGQVGDGTNAVIQWSSPVAIASADGLAYNVNLQSTTDIAHLADMDGDGVADLVYTSAAGDVYYFVNQSQVAWGPRRFMSVQDTAPPSPFGDPNVRTADLDFDKRMDIVQSIDVGGGNAYYRIWFNLGNQTYSSSVTVPQTSGFLFSAAGVQVVDFNGDRVPDIVWLRPSSVIVTAGLGYGNFADPVTVSIPDYVLDDTQVQKARLTDINGDGLADLVLERAAPGELWYWLNLGNYTFSTRKVIRDLPTAISLNAVVRWADMNGNGSTDLVYADSSASPAMLTIDLGNLLNGGLAPNTLTAISNGIGRVTLIGYQPSTDFALDDAAAGNPWPDPMPLPVTVIASVTNLDSLGHQYVTRFHYHNGYYDPDEKQFRGFAGAEQLDLGDPTAPTLITHSSFDTGRAFEAMKGKLLVLAAEQEDGQVFWTQTNAWTIPPITLYTGTNGTNVVYAHPTGTIKLIAELGQGTPRRLETEMGYDNYGNETTNADYGIVEGGDRSAWADERIVTTEYALNLDAWILRYPKRRETKALDGSVISRAEFYYDDETFSGNNAGDVTVGNPTLRREWINASNSTAYIKAARIKYDAYGNPIALLDPLGVAAGGTVDFSQGHAREVAYDTDFHTYPVAETIHVGNGSQPLVFQAAYDEGLGATTSSIDFNTNLTTYGYDPFARVISIVKPYDTPAYPTVEYEYALAQSFGPSGLVNYIETRQLDTSTNQAPGSDHRSHYFISRQFVDGLGRVLMTKLEAEPDANTGSPRVIIQGAVQFNARQKPSLTLNPCYSLGAGVDLDSLLAFEDISTPGWQGTFGQNGQLVNLPFAAAPKVSLAYDATLRDLTTTNQDGTFRRTVYEPLLAKSYDENQTDPASPFFGLWTAHYQDGLMRLARVDEIARLNDDGTPAGSPQTWTTTYAYDVNDQLTRITDSQQNVKSLSHDGLKRLAFANDPDRGVMFYAYDDASNLTDTTDARNQHIRYAYDGANRMLTETYVGSALSPRLGEDRGEGAVNVAYHYDVPAGLIDNGDGTRGMAENTRGMLAYVSDGSGEEHLSYDARGRLHYIIKRIPDPQLLDSNSPPASVLVAFRTVSEYDSLDRLTRLVYPDNDEVSYEYNERTLLKRIVGGPSGSIVSNLLYWPSDQQRQIEFGNGVRTTHGYDPRLRLAALFTAPAQATSSPLVAFQYDFDLASNIRTIEDLRPGTLLPTGDKRRNTQVFEYDDLYRLTRAQYSFNPPGSSLRNDGDILYRFDRIGNLLSQTSSLDQQERGLPVANLGAMQFGGAGGRFGRQGRAATDPPGPHALTQITAATTNAPQVRVYPYDANGNMTDLDGLVCTWDYKDRIVAVENDTMRAEYTYDYTDRRITKRVIPKASGPLSSKHAAPK